jgi:hypothetical protein
MTTHEVCCFPRRLAPLTPEFKFWSLDAHLQKAELFASVSSILSSHIRECALEMPTLDQCIEALSDLHARAALPLAVVGECANTSHAPFPSQRHPLLQGCSFEPLIPSRAFAP